MSAHPVCICAGALCYRSAAFGARMRIPCMQLNGKQEADRRPACAVPATVRRPRDALPRARARAAHDATALPPGGKAAAWQAASPDTGRRKGRARCSPNARSAGDGSNAHSARVRAGFVRSIRHASPVCWPPPRSPSRFHCFDTVRAVPRPMSRAWLIGAGPGDAELLTLKAVRVIGEADVLLVDDLVNPDVLRHARAEARIEHVGKRGGHASTPQETIVASMLAHLRAGRSVARLKGGDPFVFGRGGEELLALGAAGFPVEIVNGITAGIAAPAALGIPVTHRGDAQGVIFVTGHGAADDEPDWHALAATRMTLVVYMGIRRVDAIIAALRADGLPDDTPCAAIESATRDGQRHALATLATLVEQIRAKGIGSPAIVVIGRVAALAADPAVQAALAGGAWPERA